MLAWWGPILHEYYAGTETDGLTYVGPEDWLAHPGTVGRAVMGRIHICDEEGAELPRLPTGKLYKRLLKDRYWGEKNSHIVRGGIRHREESPDLEVKMDRGSIP